MEYDIAEDSPIVQRLVMESEARNQRDQMIMQYLESKPEFEQLVSALRSLQVQADMPREEPETMESIESE